MKKLGIVCGLLALTLVACPKTDVPSSKVDQVSMTTVQLGLPATSYISGTYGLDSVMVGNNIYFANRSNSGRTQFFVRYSPSSNTFSGPLAVSTEFCGCGYSNKLVSDGTNIFYIGNKAVKYEVSSDTWKGLTYPFSVQTGEPGTVYHEGNIYLLGNRGESTVFKHYNIASDSWITDPNYLYATDSSEMAVYKDRIYAFGGIGIPTKVSYYSLTTKTWVALKDAPSNIISGWNYVRTATLGDYIYHLQGDGKIMVYDPNFDTWSSKPLEITGNPTSSLNLHTNGLKLYVTTDSPMGYPQVFEITPKVN